MMDYDNEEWDESLDSDWGSDFGRNRYSNAYGDYSGGYGPGGFGPRPRFEAGRGFGPGGPRGRSWGPPPPPAPPLMMGRGFGARGPPFKKPPMNNRAIQYLIRCGVSKEHLKNLPQDLLDAIDPEYCGLCGHSFDSFSTSRIHYISKNHLKAQKKWLTHNNEMLYSRSNQLPFKARELYCEICDVHITSKSHSESHYSGKGHRAVVEGHKISKNPFLLQPGMESRLDQLIRREKKHLKAANVEDEKLVAQNNFEEPKPVPQELYCEICKTSVTCTEQMRMHMNGKKHLSKEKSHILRLMKSANNPQGNENYQASKSQACFTLGQSDVTGQSDNVTEKQNVVGEQHGPMSIQVEGASEQQEQNYDWGKGSGSWE